LRKRIGKYKLIKEIGRGGMGEVYLAEDTESGEKLALKILPPELTRSPQYVERFHREAKAISSLDHPNIIKVYEIGEEEGVHYIAMEFLGGAALGDLLRKRGRLPVSEAVRIIISIAEALECAHSSGIVHRDVKPDNILSDENGRFKIMDFGIARITEGTQLTMTGTIMGTPEYMSPEQAGGKKVDQRTDIYSLGIVFYEMLTGRVPFHAETALEVIQMHLTQTPESPKTLNPNIPGNLSAIIGKMVEKNPADRYASFRHVVNAISQAIPKTMIEATGAHATAIQPKKEPLPARHPAEKAGTRVKEQVVLRIPTSVKAAFALSIILNVVLFVMYMIGKPSSGDEQQVKNAFALGSQVFATPVEADGMLYIGAQDGTVYACDLHSGKVGWTFSTGGQITAAPLVDGDYVYVGSWDNCVYALNAAAGGMLVWKADVGDIVSATPVLFAGVLYVTTRNGVVYALEAPTGATRWKDTTSASPKLPPTIHDGILLVDDDRTSLLAYDTRAGKRLGRFPAGEMKTPPVSAGDRLYYVQFDDESGRYDVRFFQVQPGPSSDRLRVTQPQWSISISTD